MRANRVRKQRQIFQIQIVLADTFVCFTGAPGAFRIPVSALIFDRRGLRVATVDAQNHVVLKPVTIARDLGSEVSAVALGPGASQAAAQLGDHGATTLYASDDAVYAMLAAEWPAAQRRETSSR